jgi:hypothetical protein
MQKNRSPSKIVHETSPQAKNNARRTGVQRANLESGALRVPPAGAGGALIIGV